LAEKENWLRALLVQYDEYFEEAAKNTTLIQAVKGHRCG
jgi:hypothetical protein